MSSPWITHVKNYQAQHGGSYKDAMSNSRASYQSMSGGKFSVARAFKKTKKGLKTANQFYDQNSALINAVAGEDTARVLAQARGYSGQADALTGGKFNLHNAMRKTKNTARQVKNVARIAAPILSVVAPEIGIPLEAAVLATGGSFRVQGGSFRVQGGAVRGGGLHGAHSVGVKCAQCGAVARNMPVRTLTDPNRQ